MKDADVKFAMMLPLGFIMACGLVKAVKLFSNEVCKVRSLNGNIGLLFVSRNFL